MGKKKFRIETSKMLTPCGVGVEDATQAAGADCTGFLRCMIRSTTGFETQQRGCIRRGGLIWASEGVREVVRLLWRWWWWRSALRRSACAR